MAVRYLRTVGAGERDGLLLSPLCPDCLFMLRGEQPACWKCERTTLDADGAEALEVWRLLELGMSWELALETLAWVGTREELRGLTDRIAIIKTELNQPTDKPCPPTS